MTTPVYDRIGFGSSLEAGLQLACIEILVANTRQITKQVRLSKFVKMIS